MLQTLRQNLLVKRVVLIAVLVVMVLGIGIGVTAVFSDLLGTGGGSGTTASGPWAMKIGPETISPQAFQNEMRGLMRQYESQGMSESPEFLARLRYEAMSGLLRRTIALQQARRLGLKVTDREVSERITSMPGLQRNGRFVGSDEYKRLLARNEMDVVGFESQVRDDLLAGKWEQVVGAGAVVTDREVDEEIARRNEKVRYDYILLDVTKFAPAAPAETEIKTYYDAHPERFQRGEGRRARVVVVASKDAEQQVAAPTDDELKQAWQANRERYTGTFEESKAEVGRQIRFERTQDELQKRANLLRSAVTDAASLDAAASKSGLKVEDTGLLHRDPEGQSKYGPTFIDALFRATAGAVEGPVDTLSGSAVFVLTDTEPPRRATLEESRAEISAALSKEKGHAAALTAARNAIAGAGDDLAAVAKKLGATVQSGKLAGRGEPAGPLGYDPSVEKTAFAAVPGKIAEPVATLGGSLVVLKVVEKKTPDAAAVASARAQIRADMLRTRQMMLVNSVLGSILDSMQKRNEVQSNESFFKELGT